MALRIPDDEPRHPWGARWLALQTGVSIVRVIAHFRQAGEIKAAIAAVPDSVKRSRIHVPSREKGRSIIVDVFEPTERPATPSILHLNAHGQVGRP